MTDISIGEIDFEVWASLASSEPQSFEKLRRDKISALINNSTKSNQHRLRCLQWRIDKIRDKNKGSPMDSCLAISELMWDTFQQLSNLLQDKAENGSSAPRPAMQASIIPFPTKPEI